jgi:hypothetical protein
MAGLCRDHGCQTGQGASVPFPQSRARVWIGWHGVPIDFEWTTFVTLARRRVADATDERYPFCDAESGRSIGAT